MSLQKNSQRRSQSSTRSELARDLHDSLAQELVVIGYKLDLLIADLPFRFKGALREIRSDVTASTQNVRRELFALRANESDYQAELSKSASPLNLTLHGEISALSSDQKRIVNELVRNAASHSKGHVIHVEISNGRLLVSDDGEGMFGIAELVENLGGTLEVNCNSSGTKVEVKLP